MATVYGKNSFIKTRNVLSSRFLDVNSLPNMPKSIYDEDFVITPKYHQRPDLLANDIYGSPQLWWVFALRNLDELVDPYRDFKSGLLIKLPSAETVENVLAR